MMSFRICLVLVQRHRLCVLGSGTRIVVLSISNPAINQAVQICKAEGALEWLRKNTCVDPANFTE